VFRLRLYSRPTGLLYFGLSFHSVLLTAKKRVEEDFLITINEQWRTQDFSMGGVEAP